MIVFDGSLSIWDRRSLVFERVGLVGYLALAGIHGTFSFHSCV